MVESFIQCSAFKQTILKTVFVSIPEEFFLVMFTLILVGEFDYWKEAECKRLINRFDYVRVFLPTITGALLSEILRYMGYRSGIFQFIPFIIMYILIALTNDIVSDANSLRWMAKTFIFLMSGILIIGISEFLYTPFVLHKANLSLAEVNDSFLLYFLLSLPMRLIQFSILLYFVCKKRTLLKGKLLKPILSNPVLAVIFGLILFLNILFLELVYKAIVVNGMFVVNSHELLTIVLIGIVLFPMINISGTLWGFYHMKNKDTSEKKIASDKLHILQKEIELYSNSGSYDNIVWKFNEIGIDIEKIADSLYKENNTDKL